ncbi:hypothetical protein N0V90_011403 [Kalmusia sp. IMI 367209]|nr:hypothetical protein N0V90_011403 [Kalmusia sp. IMI 367209]
MGLSFNKQIVNTLLPTGERLRELRDEFGSLAEEQRWLIHSFQEQHGVAALGGAKVVEDTSSCLNLPAREISEHIERNHMEMCRFIGLNDPEYSKVRRALLRMVDPISEYQQTQPMTSMSNDQRQMLLESLQFDQLDARQMSIKVAHAKTCKWLLKTPEYEDWLDSKKLADHNGLLWIKGKPGAGKSTLMKFANTHARRTMKDTIVISFFFNARGESLEKSTVGTYRSLLLQLLQQLPELQCVFDSLTISVSAISPSYQWSAKTLEFLLEQVIQNLGRSSLVCFIDALDECEEDQVRDMILFFQSIGEMVMSAGLNFRLCFASRHYPHITVEKGLNLVLEGHEGHEEDLASYLSSQLRIGHTKLAETIRTEVKEKASGVFMWVVLVVGILNKEFERGRVHALRRKLQELPRDLHTLFRDILTRDTDNIPDLVLCIQWVLFAKVPLSPEELYFAVLSGVEPSVVTEWDPEQLSVDDMCRYLLNCSKGLTEVTKSKNAKVQFIHESVRDFLLKEDGLASIISHSGTNFHAQSHDTLRKCCLGYMHIVTNKEKELYHDDLERSEDPQKIAELWPFMWHAVQNIISYADLAQGGGIDQSAFLETFPLVCFIEYSNTFEKHAIRKYQTKNNVSLLYILAERNAAHLCNIMECVPSYLQIEKQRYGPPLLAALANDSKDVVKVFLQAELTHQEFPAPLKELYEEYLQSTEWQNIGITKSFVFRVKKSIDSHLAEACGIYLPTFLLETGRLDINSKESNPHMLLAGAVAQKAEAVVRVIVKRINVDGSSLRAWSIFTPPLRLAMENRNDNIVKMLLKVTPFQEELYHTLLQSAAETGYAIVVKILLDRYMIEPGFSDWSVETAFIKAIRNDQKTIVELMLQPCYTIANQIERKLMRLVLLSDKSNGRLITLDVESIFETTLAHKGVDINYRDVSGQTLLHKMAKDSEYNNLAERVLREAAINPDLKDHSGRTPLSVAAEESNDVMVEMLLQTKRVEIDSSDFAGRTPLFWALMNLRGVRLGQWEKSAQATRVVELLLETGKSDTKKEYMLEHML